jgi:hypothetical protein
VAEHEIRITWLEGACADRGAFLIAPADEGLRIVIRTFRLPFECPAIGFFYGATLALNRPVDASLIDVSYEEVPAPDS